MKDKKPNNLQKQERTAFIFNGIAVLIFTVVVVGSFWHLNSQETQDMVAQKEAEEAAMSQEASDKRAFLERYSELKLGTYPLTKDNDGAYCGFIGDYVVVTYQDDRLMKSSALKADRVQFGTSVDENTYINRESEGITTEKIIIAFPEDAAIQTCKSETVVKKLRG